MVPFKRQARIKRHAPKKKRSTTPTAKQLLPDEPIGKYGIDTVAVELFATGVKGESTIEFVRMLRNKLSLAADRATTAAKQYFIELPRRLQLTKRLFGDLDNKHFQKLMQRASELSPRDVVVSWKDGHLPPPPILPKQLVTVDDVLATLKNASTVITDFLAIYRPQGNPGNHDPLLRFFVEEVFELWRDILWLEGLEGWHEGLHDQKQPSRDEERLFVRLVAAAWQDFRFPLEDAKGQILGDKGAPLEEWIAARVKAHFSDGIRESRLTLNWEVLREDVESSLTRDDLDEPGKAL